MTSVTETNVPEVEQADVRLFALLTIWSDLIAALRKEPRPVHKHSAIVNMATWRVHAGRQSGFPAPLYRMTAEGAAFPHDPKRPEADLLEELAGTGGTALAETSLSRNVKIALVRAVDELPRQERTVVALYYFERLPLKAIKGALNVSESRVSQIHARAVKLLRYKLDLLLRKVVKDMKEARPTTDTSLRELLDRFNRISPASESAAIRNGLSANTWNALQLLGFDRADIATVVGSSEKTIHRKFAMSETLGVAEGDRTMRFIRVMLHAFEALGDIDKALMWLRRPNRALSGQTPLEMMVTEAGTALIRRALGVIAYGGVA